MKANFSNINNKNIKVNYDDIKLDFWISRSIAVVGVIFAVTPAQTYVLVVQRSEKMDEPNKWCLPCGYLDWNETCYQAMVREVYEETGLYINNPNIGEKITKNTCNPFRIQDDPNKDAKQNVSFAYLVRMDLPEEEIPREVETFVNDETKQIKWLSLSHEKLSNYEWAFNHDSIINEASYHLR